jgi:hypothetical protein
MSNPAGINDTWKIWCDVNEVFVQDSRLYSQTPQALPMPLKRPRQITSNVSPTADICVAILEWLQLASGHAVKAS